MNGRIPDKIEIRDDGVFVDGEPFPFVVLADTIKITVDQPDCIPTIRLTLIARGVEVQRRSIRRAALASARAEAFNGRHKVS